MTTKPTVTFTSTTTYALPPVSRLNVIRWKLGSMRMWYREARLRGSTRMYALRYAYVYRDECMFDIM